METITAIKTTLANIAPRIVGIESDWWIIGGAALALRGVDVGETHDIDILTDRDGSEEFKAALSDIRENTPKTKEDHLFRSSFARFYGGELDIEVMGDLEVCVSGQWTKVNVKEFNIFNIGSLAVKIPTLSEMRRILLLFGREKDLRRIEAIDKYCE